MNSKELMLRQIDALRNRLYGISCHVDALSDPQIVRVSHMLDRKIVSYQKQFLANQNIRA